MSGAIIMLGWDGLDLSAGRAIAGKDGVLVLAAGLWTLYLCRHLYRRTRAGKWPSVLVAVDTLAVLALVPISDDSASDVIQSDGMQAALALGWTLVIAHVAYGLLVLVALGQSHDWFLVAIAPSGIVANFLLPVWAALLVWRLGTGTRPVAENPSEVSE